MIVTAVEGFEFTLMLMKPLWNRFISVYSKPGPFKIVLSYQEAVIRPRHPHDIDWSTDPLFETEIVVDFIHGFLQM